eukprot:CAMPEP_0116573890 /NCGR_PEP_ID=MMETSP0397-20121206/19061_1 /TAXON_ID=216820 /ORGANISM="Cyclophora tenuis, Strain ECT3854" /LENGTH=164 /DNA_ID=CAMNT_0004102537 /DNA_START=14 /DNA_END=510 /DNA_ORIENTATION=+
MVFKSFKHIGEGLHDMKQYKQIEVSTVASFLSNHYNKSTRPAHCGRVSYLDACVVEEKSDEHEEIGERRFCAEEPLPPGKFIKFSNNTGYWDESHLDETLLRFTLFTFEATGGYLMLTDLQGVKEDPRNPTFRAHESRREIHETMHGFYKGTHEGTGLDVVDIE